MDFLALCRDYRIEVATQHHHVSPGWVGVHCPFCAGSKNYHLGFNLNSNSFHCWRCGTHPMDEVLERLTGQSFPELYGRYGGGSSKPMPVRRKQIKPVSTQMKPLSLPKGFTGALRPGHAAYLERRGFDPEFLKNEWGLESTSPTAMLEDAKFSNRIFIPVHWQGVMVSFQARTVSSKVKPKYRNCPAEVESFPSRRLVYRHPNTISPYGICVEGPTDVWRVGRHAFATLGINFSQAQSIAIARLYRKVMVVYDPEFGAQRRAKEVVDSLCIHGVDAWIHNLPEGRDPGDLRPEEARELVSHLLTRQEH